MFFVLFFSRSDDFMIKIKFVIGAVEIYIFFLLLLCFFFIIVVDESIDRFEL